VKTAAQTLRQSPKLDIERAISELAVGEALVSLLDEKGIPRMTERAWMAPPSSRIGPIEESDRDRIRRAGQALYGHYEKTVDRESAYEKLKTGMPTSDQAPTTAPPAKEGEPPSSRTPSQSPATASVTSVLTGVLLGTTGPRGGHHDGLLDAAAKSAARAAGSNFGRAIIRGALGSILGGRSR
jgi:hypothetical protein